MRIRYRIRQFWRAVSLKTDSHELDQACLLLSLEQRELFARLQPGEKRHVAIMLSKLLEQGEAQPDLLVATLLHDVGKLRYRLHPLERAMVVIIHAIKPQQSLQWGRLPPDGWDGLPGWRKAFITAEHHAEWGAEMAHIAGASPLTEALIRAHHHPHSYQVGSLENSLLNKLWVVDNQS